MQSAKIFSGNNSQQLAEQICKRYGTRLGKVNIQRFSDGEISPIFLESVRGDYVFLVQSTHSPAENLMELLLMIDAARRASADKVIAVIPYYGYARQDRKDRPRVAIGSKLVANMLTKAGADRIITMDLQQLGGTIIAQKDAFLCAAKGVSVGIHFQRRLGTGIFGGEGFIMQKLEGDGMAFMHAGGYVIEKELAPGEILKVDTGCVVAYTPGIDFDIEFVRGVRNLVFGGEGLFFARLQGPGKVWIQSLPISRLASRIVAYGTYNRKEEGSLLGGLGNILDGRE